MLVAFMLDHVEGQVLEVVRHREGWGALRLVTKGLSCDVMRYSEFVEVVTKYRHCLRRVSCHLLKRPYGPGTPMMHISSHNIYFKSLSGAPAVSIQRENVWGTTNEFMPSVVIKGAAWDSIIRYQDNIFRALISVEDWGLSQMEREALVRRYHIDYFPNELSNDRARRSYMRQYQLN